MWLLIVFTIFIALVIAEQVFTKHNIPHRPSELLWSLSTFLNAVFYKLGVWLALLSDFPELVGRFFRRYLLAPLKEFWAALRAILDPISEICFSWVEFFRGYAEQMYRSQFPLLVALVTMLGLVVGYHATVHLVRAFASQGDISTVDVLVVDSNSTVVSVAHGG